MEKYVCAGVPVNYLIILSHNIIQWKRTSIYTYAYKSMIFPSRENLLLRANLIVFLVYSKFYVIEHLQKIKKKNEIPKWVWAEKENNFNNSFKSKKTKKTQKIQFNILRFKIESFSKLTHSTNPKHFRDKIFLFFFVLCNNCLKTQTRLVLCPNHKLFSYLKTAIISWMCIMY